MKKLIYLAVLLISISATAATPPEVSEKVLKAFRETFTNAENVVWNEEDNHCQAFFNQSEIQVRALYDNDGNLLKTTRNYGERRPRRRRFQHRRLSWHLRRVESQGRAIRVRARRTTLRHRSCIQRQFGQLVQPHTAKRRKLRLE